MGCSDIREVIRNQISQLEAKDALLFVYSDSAVIFQSEAEDIPRLPELTKEQGYEVIQYKGEKYFMCHLKSSTTGWMYVNLFPYSEIYGQIMMIRYLVLGAFLVTFVAAFVIMRKVAAVITSPLEQLTESMRIVEYGDFQGAKKVLTYETSRDEVGILSQELMTNDAYPLVVSQYLGEISTSYDGPYDTTTFCGAFENICYQLRQKYCASQLIYISPHKMPTRDREVQEVLHNLAGCVCRKWLVSFDNGNGTHLNEEGYRIWYAPLIEAELIKYNR